MDFQAQAVAVAMAEVGTVTGVRIEDTCVYLENGIEILTGSPKNLIIV